MVLIDWPMRGSGYHFAVFEKGDQFALLSRMGTTDHGAPGPKRFKWIVRTDGSVKAAAHDDLSPQSVERP